MSLALTLTLMTVTAYKTEATTRLGVTIKNVTDDSHTS
tara:strand:+ start:1520 stop:1633 length:114 start_codon:yes stop_codon:yes gene_type:complete